MFDVDDYIHGKQKLFKKIQTVFIFFIILRPNIKISKIFVANVREGKKKLNDLKKHVLSRFD